MGHDAGRAHRVLDNLANDGAGRLTLGPSRFLLIRPETIVGIQRALDTTLGARADAPLVAGGRAGGTRAAGALTGSPAERVAQLVRMGAELGWGQFTLERLTRTGLVITVRHSPFAEAYGPASAPVCHLIRGVLEAVTAEVLERPVPVMETACAASGAALCRFETEPRAPRAGHPSEPYVPRAGHPRSEPGSRSPLQ